jgi:hypothetical protein
VAAFTAILRFEIPSGTPNKIICLGKITSDLIPLTVEGPRRYSANDIVLGPLVHFR